MFKPLFRASLMLTMLVLITSEWALGQYVMGEDKPERTESAQFLGIGTGINDIGLLGAHLEHVINPNFSAFGTIGLGGWGYKLGLGASYYFKGAPFGPSFNMSYTHSTGIRNFEIEMPIEPDDQPSPVVMDFLPAGAINVTYAYHWTLGKKGKFSLIGGYAFSTSNEPYRLKTSGVVLSATSHTILDIQKPGGFVLGLRFMKGI